MKPGLTSLAWVVVLVALVQGGCGGCAPGNGGADGGDGGNGGQDAGQDAGDGGGQDAGSRTFLIPDFREGAGTLADGEGKSDSSLQVVYAGGLTSGTSGTTNVSVTLLAPDGGPLRSGTNNEICNPCTASVSTSQRGAVFDFQSKVSGAGGFGGSDLSGMAVVQVTGADPASVAVQGLTQTAADAGTNTRVLSPMQTTELPGSTRHLVQYGIQDIGGGTFGTRISVAHGGGVGSIPAGSTATAALRLYGQDGALLKNGGGTAICDPCSATVSASNRMATFNVASLYTMGGGSLTQVPFHAVIDVSGGSEAVGITGVQTANFNPGGQPSVMALPIGPPRAAGTQEPVVLVTPEFALGSSLDAIFATTLFAGIQGISGNTATIEHYWYSDTTGAPQASGTGTTICNPCSRSLTQGVDAQDLTQAFAEAVSKGGLTGDRHGFWTTTVRGNGAAATFQHAHHLNSNAAAGTTSRTSTQLKTFVLPHMLEKSGRATSMDNTFDTQIFAVYTAGLSGVSAATPGASVSLYLYDAATGAEMKSATNQSVCAPCTFALGTGDSTSVSPRKRTISVDDLIVAKGGFSDALVKLGFGVIVVSGDSANVSLQGFVVNSHNSAFDLSVFGFSPVELQAEP
jgi:hypothetical protein